MYGVSLTSGQPVTIVQKFPDLLQQVVFEVSNIVPCTFWFVSDIYLLDHSIIGFNYSREDFLLFFFKSALWMAITSQVNLILFNSNHFFTAINKTCSQSFPCHFVFWKCKKLCWSIYRRKRTETGYDTIHK